MARLRLGVIGLGRMGQVYATHIARGLDNAELAAVADPRADVAAQFAARVGVAAVYADHGALLAHRGLDAVVVATPTSTHREVVLAAAAGGKPVFCEKPPALTLEATDEMVAACERARVPFFVGLMRRFDSGYVEARRRIDAGVIGTPVAIRSIGRDPHRTSLEYASPAVSGGLLVDMAIHDFDSVRWLMGDEVQRVYAETASLVYPELSGVGDVDTAIVSLRLAGGGLASVEASRTAAYGYDIRCEVVGTKGALQIGYLQQTPVLTLTREGVSHDVVPHFPERFASAYTAQIAHFVDCIAGGGAPRVTPGDARAALRIALAATTSHLERRIVTLD
jgi:scyllo-inositol 2-dehydrogenase (NAD+)